MNILVTTLNRWGDCWCAFANALLWQLTILIVVLLVLDLLLAKILHPSTRYLLWLLVLVKLVIPPAFAAPSSPAWWFRHPIEFAQVPSRNVRHELRLVI